MDREPNIIKNMGGRMAEEKRVKVKLKDNKDRYVNRFEERMSMTDPRRNPGEANGKFQATTTREIIKKRERGKKR